MSNFIEVKEDFYDHNSRILLNSDHIYSVEENSENNCHIVTGRAIYDIDMSFDELKKLLTSKGILKFENGKLTEVIPL